MNEIHPDIFRSDADAIINTINCVGVMGGGLAAQFRERYPEMNAAYQTACARGEVKIGKMWSWFERQDGRWLINFPTKLDWRNPSELSYVTLGLKDLRAVIVDLSLKSIAIPPLGCGLGGLSWADVEPMIRYSLHGLTADVVIYPPNGQPYVCPKDRHDAPA
jgi:O-acetyl-ADP-ribose deacetylase (regulator of RNase III)